MTYRETLFTPLVPLTPGLVDDFSENNSTKKKAHANDERIGIRSIDILLDRSETIPIDGSSHTIATTEPLLVHNSCYIGTSY